MITDPKPSVEGSWYRAGLIDGKRVARANRDDLLPDLVEALRLLLERFGHTDWESVHDSAAIAEARSLLQRYEESDR